MEFGRETCALAKMNWDYLYAEGGFKNVYEGVFTTGPRSNQPCVGKEIKRGIRSYSLENDVTLSYKALDLVTKFNRTQDHIPVNLYVNIPEVVPAPRFNPPKHLLLEPLIRNFVKYNSNSGWTLDDGSFYDEIAQALSHYTYHCTRGNLLLCDIQGGRFNKGFALTDPVIMSHFPGRYGPTDLGRDGIITFFAYHDCNEYCMDHWTRPRQRRPVFSAQRGTSMIFRPTAATSR